MVGFGQMELILTTTIVMMQTPHTACINSIIIIVWAGPPLPVQVVAILSTILVNFSTDTWEIKQGSFMRSELICICYGSFIYDNGCNVVLIDVVVCDYFCQIRA